MRKLNRALRNSISNSEIKMTKENLKLKSLEYEKAREVQTKFNKIKKELLASLHSFMFEETGLERVTSQQENLQDDYFTLIAMLNTMGKNVEWISTLYDEELGKSPAKDQS